jgi:hypothetical protein
VEVKTITYDENEWKLVPRDADYYIVEAGKDALEAYEIRRHSDMVRYLWECMCNAAEEPEIDS